MLLSILTVNQDIVYISCAKDIQIVKQGFVYISLKGCRPVTQPKQQHFALEVSQQSTKGCKVLVFCNCYLNLIKSFLDVQLSHDCTASNISHSFINQKSLIRSVGRSFQPADRQAGTHQYIKIEPKFYYLQTQQIILVIPISSLELPFKVSLGK